METFCVKLLSRPRKHWRACHGFAPRRISLPNWAEISPETKGASESPQEKIMTPSHVRAGQIMDVKDW
jgi:hypothetical protein